MSIGDGESIVVDNFRTIGDPVGPDPSAPIPEPGAALLFGLGALTVAARRRQA